VLGDTSGGEFEHHDQDGQAVTSTPDSALPRYADPPVSEVVLSVQFDALERLTPAHMGVWWDRDGRRDRYPICEVHPPEQPVAEIFDSRVAVPTFSLQLLGGGMPAPALWFVAEDQGAVVRLQTDRFSRNWRRVEQEPYPSYGALRPAFEQELVAFTEFVADQGLGSVMIKQCEVRYINPIAATDEWETHGALAQALAPWSSTYSDDYLPQPENLQFAARFTMPDDAGAPAGRLHVQGQPAAGPDGAPILLLTLVGRGRPPATGMDAALSFLDTIHEWIVRGFTSVTSSSMHDQWKRTS
jgi:uncharacterized protein (TIGR04255 family)